MTSLLSLPLLQSLHVSDIKRQDEHGWKAEVEVRFVTTVIPYKFSCNQSTLDSNQKKKMYIPKGLCISEIDACVCENCY